MNKFTDREELIRYMKEQGIQVKGVHKKAMLHKGGVGAGMAILFRKGDDIPVFSRVTKKRVLKLLGLSYKSKEEDFEIINKLVQDKIL